MRAQVAPCLRSALVRGLVAAILGLSSCKDTIIYDDEQPPKIAERVSRYTYALRADAEFVSTTVGSSKRAISGTAAALGLVKGIAESSDGILYVLDAERKHIVRFDSTGTPLNIVEGGYGIGPGQFVNPMQLAVDNDNNLYVLDTDRRQISVFDEQGRFATTVPIREGEAFDFVVADSQLWVLRSMGAKSTHAVSVYPMHGKHMKGLIPIGDRQREFAGGSLGALANGPDGSVIYAHTEPGAWRVASEKGVSVPFGAEALPTSRVQSEKIAERLTRLHIPGGTLATGMLSPDRVGVLWFTEEADRYELPGGLPDWKARFTYYLDVSTTDGQYLGTTPLPSGFFITAAQFEPRSKALFIGTSTPTPRVVRLTLEESPVLASRSGTVRKEHTP